MYDVVIIGGGINGVGIARDAAGRGLNTCLIEKGDIASQTSSWSTKLIHGGIRYLENYDFRLVRESLIERDVIKKIAPHITKPLKFVLPHVPSLRPSWIIRIGLFLYDRLSGKSTFEKSKCISLDETFKENPIKENFKSGYVYSDLFVDDSRLALLNAEDAINKGAKVYTNTNIIKTIRDKDNWSIFLDNGEVLKSKAVVNATGPFAISVLNNIFGIKSKKKLRLVQGSHLVVKKIYDGDQAYILQLNDKRIIFMIPFKKKYTLIGTTDHEVEDFENPKITYEEKTYLINSVNSFIKNEIDDNDIVWTYSGVRPLIEDNNQKASKVSRDYAFEIDDRDGAPILTVFGGKLTTYRKLSEQVLKKLSKYILVSNKTWTSYEVLPGATDININSENIPKEILERLIETYGAKISKLNEYYNEFNAGGDLIFEDFYEFEVKYLIKEEMARTSEDILFRRTKLGINFPKEAKDKLEIILKRHL